MKIKNKNIKFKSNGTSDISKFKKRTPFALAIIIVIVSIIALNYKFNIIDKIIKVGIKKEETVNITYQIYDNQTENKLKT